MNHRSDGEQCNCENTACDHERACPRRAMARNKVQYIGAVCDDCYALYPEQFRVVDPIQARAFLAETVRRRGSDARDEKTQLELLAYDLGYEGQALPEWSRSLGKHWSVDVDDLWHEGYGDRRESENKD